MPKDYLGTKIFKYNEISAIEPLQGLYAWYLRIDIGEENLKTEKNTTISLKKFVKQLAYPPINIDAKGRLSLKLVGKLKHVFYGKDENRFTQGLSDILSEDEDRIRFAEVLKSAAPIFSNPLYIGISKNLARRIKGHSALIEKYKKLADEPLREKSKEVSRDGDKNFAMRVCMRKMDPNNLIVGILYTDNEKLSKDQISTITKNSETILNRIFHPILGRR